MSYSGVVSTKAKTVKRASKPARARNPQPKLNPKRIAEDEDDYRFSQKSLKSGKPIPLAKVLKELGYRVER
jgi:uncharacterized protein involved in outer membrane biogenesis